MKAKVKTVSLIIITLALVIVSNINTRVSKVVESYFAGDVMVLVTDDGNIWEIERNDNTRNPQAIKFDTKGTKDVTDDIIMEVYEK